MMTDLLARLQNVRRNGEGWTARCPSHGDHENSLTVDHREGKWLLKCHAGCDWQDIAAALGLQASDLSDESSRMGAGGAYPSGNRATAQRSPGLSLEAYAEAKKIPV